jgi:hypothetical protein
MAVWMENDADWFEERMIHCGLCGRMIAKHFLQEHFPTGDVKFCSEDCLGLYHNYLLVERGEAYLRPDNIGVTYADLMVE